MINSALEKNQNLTGSQKTPKSSRNGRGDGKGQRWKIGRLAVLAIVSSLVKKITGRNALTGGSLWKGGKNV